MPGRPGRTVRCRRRGGKAALLCTGLAWLFVSALAARAADLPVVDMPAAGDFTIAQGGHAVEIVVDSEDRAVRRVADDLAQDIERVTQAKPVVVAATGRPQEEAIVIGTIGHSPLIDGLAKAGRLDTRGVAGEWESAVVATVAQPWPGVDRALVVAGSDRRGAIYGAYSISESIGVSPWVWWADVPPRHRATVGLAAGSYRLGPPAVKYRGIFLNDEDWGLRPWAAHTLDPKTGNIGPATYRHVFELLLRLRGNLLWPAMHPGTRDFNFYPEDKKLADEFGIVMGSSHAEPMLRDNVDEWKRDGTGDFNYATNAAAVLRYWEERVKANGRFENIYTMGMRGIHDSGMEGGGTVDERAARLRRIIADQRDLLRRHVDPDVTRVPQLFCPYKEVMPIYEQRPDLVPDDVTLLWPDDNYGYIQHLPTTVERRRSGGSGVYYHISYWGRPYDYLWLCSTPPALIGEQMTRAWRHGARRIWVVNVGDLKPAEWDTEFFLRLAWDPSGWRAADGQHAYLRAVAARDFGPAHAEEIASILDEYYQLNFSRKPEHVGLDPKSPELAQPMYPILGDAGRAERRLADFAKLRDRADALAGAIDPAQADAYYELVLYPVRGAELMNRKWLNWERGEAEAARGEDTADDFYGAANEAQKQIEVETANYNNQIAGGKWRGIMSDAPRGLAVFKLPRRAPVVPRGNAEASASGGPAALADTAYETGRGTYAERGGRVTVVAADAAAEMPGTKTRWEIVQGLGYAGRAIAARAVTNTTTAASIGGECTYTVEINTPGEWQVAVRCLPTWPAERGHPGRLTLAFDDGAPVTLALPVYRDEHDPRWQHDVIRNAALLSTTVRLTAGRHRVRLGAADSGVVVDAILLTVAGHQPEADRATRP